MSEILFRGKAVDDGKWVEGERLSQNEKVYIVIEFELNSDYGDGTDLYATEWYEVIPETVGQYTGLKDKNGVKVYLGDILEGIGYRIIIKFGEYYYEDDNCECELDPSQGYGFHMEATKDGKQAGFLPLGEYITDWYEIIGNIHEEV